MMSRTQVHQSVVEGIRNAPKGRGHCSGILIGALGDSGELVVEDAVPLADATGETGWSKKTVAMAGEYIDRWLPGRRLVGWYRVRHGEPVLSNAEKQVAGMFPETTHLVLICDRTGSAPALFARPAKGATPEPAKFDIVESRRAPHSMQEAATEQEPPVFGAPSAPSLQPWPLQASLVRGREPRPEATLFVTADTIKDLEEGGAGLLLGSMHDSDQGLFVVVSGAKRIDGDPASAPSVVAAQAVAQDIPEGPVGWFRTVAAAAPELTSDDFRAHSRLFAAPSAAIALCVPNGPAVRFFQRHRADRGPAPADYFVLPQSPDDTMAQAASAEGLTGRDMPLVASEATRAAAKDLARAVRMLQPDRNSAPPPMSALPAGREAVELKCDAPRPEGKLATAVVFDQGALRRQALRVSRQGLGDIGLLVGRFGAQRGRPFCLVDEFHPLPDPEAADATDAASWWLDEPVRLATYAARLSALRGREGAGVVGWYYDAKRPEDSLPQKHRELRQAVFAHPRLITVALFGAASPSAAKRLRTFPHRVYVAQMIDGEAHGLAQATSVAVLTP